MVGEIDFLGATRDANAARAKGINPLGEFFAGQDQAIARKGHLQNQRMNALAIRKTEQDFTDEDILREELAANGGDVEKTLKTSTRISPAARFKLQEAVRLQTKDADAFELGRTKAELEGYKLDEAKKDKALTRLKLEHELSSLAANAVDSALPGFVKQTAIDQIIQHSKAVGDDPAPLLAGLEQIYAAYGEDGVKQVAKARALDAKDKMLKIGTVNNGAQIIPVAQSPLTGEMTQPGTNIDMQVSPGQQLMADTSEVNSKRTAASKELAARDKAAAEAGAVLSPATVSRMAQQYLNGDKSVTTSLGSGKVGAANRAALQEGITREADVLGMDPQEVAQSLAEYAALVSGERALGTRTAGVGMAVATAEQMAPIAVEISNRIDRTQYPKLNSVLMAFDQGTGGEDVVRLAGATNAIVNTYARAISPTGVANVSDKDHAREILERAYSKGQYAAGVDQIMQEMEAERKAPGKVKQEFRESGKANIASEKKTAKEAIKGPTKISSDADYAKLPSGSEFIAPDGSHRRKP